MRFVSTSPRRGAALGVALFAAVVVGLGVAGTYGYTTWKSKRDAAARRIDPTRIATVDRRDVIDSVTASGRVEPLARVAVMSRASGIVERLFADAGDHVEAGAVLVELDREQLEAQLAQDDADLLAAQARVTAAEADVAEARVRVADPEPQFLEREVQRLAELLSAGQASQKEHDDAARLLANARFRVQLVEAGLPGLEAAIAEARAGLAATEAARERSATALREATVKSPITGVVLTRDKEVGDGVSSILTAGGNATQIMTMGDLSSVHIEARVDEVDLGRVSVGMEALVGVDAHRGTTFAGRVDRIAPAGTVDDNGIVTFEVEIAVEDPKRLLRPDMTADAKLVVERRDGVVCLPQTTLIPGADGTWFVDRIVGEGDDARTERVPVTIGLSDGLVTEILTGVAVGERVLVQSVRR
jgi:HlyD family secretion protein